MVKINTFFAEWWSGRPVPTGRGRTLSWEPLDRFSKFKLFCGSFKRYYMMWKKYNLKTLKILVALLLQVLYPHTPLWRKRCAWLNSPYYGIHNLDFIVALVLGCLNLVQKVHVSDGLISGSVPNKA
jgi:hypothetical protein